MTISRISKVLSRLNIRRKNTAQDEPKDEIKRQIFIEHITHYTADKLAFLPVYSPDLNPIEKFWANLKNKIKKIISNFSTLTEVVDYVFRSIN